MTLFKQIIGRGTRLREDLGKTWFTILDFKARHRTVCRQRTLMASPCKSTEPGSGEPCGAARTGRARRQSGRPRPARRRARNPWGTLSQAAARRTAPKIHPGGNNVTVAVARERGAVPQRAGQAHHRKPARLHPHQPAEKYDSLDQFLQAWQQADRKAAVAARVEGQGVLLDALADEVGKDLDPFDLLLHVAYDQPPLTRSERARRVQKRNVFTQYGPVAPARCWKPCSTNMPTKASPPSRATKSSRFQALHRPGQPVELVRSFGGRPQYLSALQTLERELYAPACCPPIQTNASLKAALEYDEQKASTWQRHGTSLPTTKACSNIPTTKRKANLAQRDRGRDALYAKRFSGAAMDTASTRGVPTT